MLAAGAALLLLLPATATADPVGYSVAITSPKPTVAGTVTVRALVSGGVSQPQPQPQPKGGIPTPKAGIPSPKSGIPPPRDVSQPYAQSKAPGSDPNTQPKYGAYHIRTIGSWADGERVNMTRVGTGAFEAPLVTDSLPNDRYRLEVRVWGDVPPYNPRDPNTFARSIIEVAVDNAPPAPAGLQAVSPSSALRVGWNGIDTADRSDFAGYRVFQWNGACTEDTSGYTVLAQVEGALFTQRQEPGRYCLRVAAVRRSEISGELVSAFSSPVRVVLARPAAPRVLAGLVTASGGRPIPPPPPELPEPTRVFSDARFAQDLPYDGGVVTTRVAVPARVRPAPAAVTGTAVPDPQQGPALVATGLIMLCGSFLIRRFLAAPRS
jgi:hypothetical protein